MKKNKKINGRIILLQEERIRVVDDTGKSFLFDISPHFSVTSDDISDWIRTKRKVTVSYQGEPETESGVARSIKKAA